MAINDAAVLTAAKGYILTGAVGAAKPAPAAIDMFNPNGALPTGFTLLGHTSRDDLPEFGFEGGDTETKGTWQADVLKEVVTEPAADFVTFNLLQFDDEALVLYYGVANAGDPGVAEFIVKTSPGTTSRALLIVVVDGATKVGFWAPNCSIRREGSIELAVDEFGQLPLRATFLDHAAGKLGWIGGEIVGNTPALTS